MKERVRQVEKERDEMSRAKDGIEAALKAEFELRLARAMKEADRAYQDEREKFR